jgi:hypothetical protein
MRSLFAETRDLCREQLPRLVRSDHFGDFEQVASPLRHHAPDSFALNRPLGMRVGQLAMSGEPPRQRD